METMLPVLQKAINFCFNDPIIKTVALSSLGNEENVKRPMKSLQMLALKAVMKEKMKGGMESSILFNLAFREPINLSNFWDRPPVVGFLKNFKKFFTDIWTLEHLRHQTCLRLRNDPPIMLAIFEQNFQDHDTWIELIITKTHLIVNHTCDGSFDSLRYLNANLTIPNRENQEYDSFWAVKFFKSCMKIGCRWIKLKIDGKGELDLDYMRNFVDIVMESEVYRRPEEGWREAIEQGEKIIYRLNATGWSTEHFGISYTIKTDSNYDEWQGMNNQLIYYH